MAAVLAASALSAAAAAAPTSTERGSAVNSGFGALTMFHGVVISATEVVDLDAQEVREHVSEAGIDASSATFGVTAYRVLYLTADTAGGTTTASQLVALPVNDERRMDVVSWLHGTNVFRGGVGSMDETSTDRAAALLFASTGRAVSAPDYLGLGEGAGVHPYGHDGATVTASVDALQAARWVARDDGRTLGRDVIVTGFSQGAPATMLVGRALQDGIEPYFRVAALAPISGPFDLSRFEASAAADELANASLYLAYFTIAWDRMYGLYDSPGEAFRAPYDETVEALFDGYHRPQEIAAALPPASKDLFTPEFLRSIREPSGILAEKLEAMDATCDWHPEVSVSVYHASGDQDVAFDHAEHCTAQLADRGADHELVDVGNVDHNESVREALPLVVTQFDRASA